MEPDKLPLSNFLENHSLEKRLRMNIAFINIRLLIKFIGKRKLQAFMLLVSWKLASMQVALKIQNKWDNRVLSRVSTFFGQVFLLQTFWIEESMLQLHSTLYTFVTYTNMYVSF